MTISIYFKQMKMITILT